MPQLGQIRGAFPRVRGKLKSIAAAPTRRLAVFRISALLIAEPRFASAALPAFPKADFPVAFRARGFPGLPLEFIHLRQAQH